MRRVLCLALLVALFVGDSGGVVPVRAQFASALAEPCQQGELPSKALWEICIPASGWNGDVFIYAHGYVAPVAPDGTNTPLSNQDTLPDGTSIANVAQTLGYAFATTSYRQNGLTILEGVDDLRELIAAFPGVAGRAPTHVYVLGVSEGSLIATLLVERSPELVSGALAACGPIGDFQAQLNYFGDVRVLFDHFFPGTLPPNAINIPPEALANWNTTYQPAISNVIASNPVSATALISTTHAPIDTAKNVTAAQQETVLNVLWYNVFATNDASAKLGGNPYSNIGRQYSGSSDDALLNQQVAPYTANPAATERLVQYQTSGKLTRPLVVLHTTGDPIVPFAQAIQYASKVQPTGRGRFTLMPIERYGHCTFSLFEAQRAFRLLVQQVAAGETRIYVPLVGR